jgi:transposase-like protein
MNKISYSGYRFPPEIIEQAIWLYLRFTLSLRDVEESKICCVRTSISRECGSGSK